MKNTGFSLLEYLISSFLGLIILIALLQIYLSVKRTYLLENNLAAIEETGRFVTYFLLQNIHLAGYARCQNTSIPIKNKEAIYGYSAENTPSFLPKNRIPRNTDIIVIQRCGKMDNNQYFLKIAFFIADTFQKNSAGLPIYGLYEKKILAENNKSHMQEVATGIENMQIRYGITDTDGKNIIAYRSERQMQAVDWEKVRSVQISLLLNSMDNVLLSSQSYTFAGKSFPPSRQIHKEWDLYSTLMERSALSY